MGTEQVAVIPSLPEHHFETCIVVRHAFYPYPHAQVRRVDIDLFDQFFEVQFGHVFLFSAPGCLRQGDTPRIIVA